MSNAEIPSVVLIGRTNAGKSTLFNRLIEEEKAIVSPAENTTRDQTRGKIYWKGAMCELVDTGGLDTAELDSLHQEIQRQVHMAVEKASAIIFVVDGKGELMPQDKETGRWLQQLGKPVIVCINKVDGQRQRQTGTATFASLPAQHLVMCSANNGSGTGDLLDELFECIPKVSAPEHIQRKDNVTLTIVGQPNVGKSTLFNALIGEDRVIVSDIAHTTRDINDTTLDYHGKQFTILDTAGIRRKSRVGQWHGKGVAKGELAKIERYSVHAALRSIEEADVVALVVEAQQRIQNQDKTLVSHAHRNGKGLFIVVNKWDLIPDKTTSTIHEFEKYFSQVLNLHYIPMVFTSGLVGKRVTDILDLALQVQQERERVMPEEELDSILRSVQSQQPREKKKLIKGQPKKILELVSLKQTGINPPTFTLKAKKPKNVAPAIVHIIERKIRERGGYKGVSININLRD